MEIYKSFDKKQKKIILAALLISILGIIAGVIYDSSLKNLSLMRMLKI